MRNALLKIALASRNLSPSVNSLDFPNASRILWEWRDPMVSITDVWRYVDRKSELPLIRGTMRLREMIRIGKIIGVLLPTLEFAARRSGLCSLRSILTIRWNSCGKSSFLVARIPTVLVQRRRNGRKIHEGKGNRINVGKRQTDAKRARDEREKERERWCSEA